MPSVLPKALRSSARPNRQNSKGPSNRNTPTIAKLRLRSQAAPDQLKSTPVSVSISLEPRGEPPPTPGLSSTYERLRQHFVRICRDGFAAGDDARAGHGH